MNTENLGTMANCFGAVVKYSDTLGCLQWICPMCKCPDLTDEKTFLEHFRTHHSSCKIHTSIIIQTKVWNTEEQEIPLCSTQTVQFEYSDISGTGSNEHSAFESALPFESESTNSRFSTGENKAELNADENISLKLELLSPLDIQCVETDDEDERRSVASTCLTDDEDDWDPIENKLGKKAAVTTRWLKK